MKKQFRGKLPQNHIPNILGPVGETLLDRPFYWKINTSEDGQQIEQFKKDLPVLFFKSEPRLLILDSALLIEERFDEILKVVIPDYKQLSMNRDFTFSMKIELLNSMRLIPKKILFSAHIIRKLRNTVAHNLKCEPIVELQNKKDAIQEALKEYYETPDSNTDILENYRSLVICVLTGLVMYNTTVEHFYEYIRNCNISDLIENNYQQNK